VLLLLLLAVRPRSRPPTLRAFIPHALENVVGCATPSLRPKSHAHPCILPAAPCSRSCALLRFCVLMLVGHAVHEPWLDLLALGPSRLAHAAAVTEAETGQTSVVKRFGCTPHVNRLLGHVVVIVVASMIVRLRGGESNHTARSTLCLDRFAWMYGLGVVQPASTAHTPSSAPFDAALVPRPPQRVTLG
jgi:hypothetical protein